MAKPSTEKDREKGNKYGPMAPSMMDFGLMTWPMEKESFYNTMEDNTKEILKMIDFMAQENSSLQTKVLFMKENSISIFSMDMEPKFPWLKSTSTQEILRMI